jgi:predicted SprT family Zn-dependent metalloprotease
VSILFNLKIGHFMCLSNTKNKVSILFEKLNLEYELGYSLKFSNTVRALGSCNWSKKIIKISQKYMELCSWDIIEDTIRHEIAHAIDAKRRGYSKHDYVWKKVCLEVGADPSRTADVPKEMTPQRKYLKVCGKCQKTLGQTQRNTFKYKNQNVVHTNCWGVVSLVPNPKYK